MLAHFVLFVNLKNLENNTEAKKERGCQSTWYHGRTDRFLKAN